MEREKRVIDGTLEEFANTFKILPGEELYYFARKITLESIGALIHKRVRVEVVKEQWGNRIVSIEEITGVYTQESLPKPKNLFRRFFEAVLR